MSSSPSITVCTQRVKNLIERDGDDDEDDDCALLSINYRGPLSFRLALSLAHVARHAEVITSWRITNRENNSPDEGLNRGNFLPRAAGNAIVPMYCIPYTHKARGLVTTRNADRGSGSRETSAYCISRHATSLGRNTSARSARGINWKRRNAMPFDPLLLSPAIRARASNWNVRKCAIFFYF